MIFFRGCGHKRDLTVPSGTDSESWPILGLHMALPSVADCWAPAGRTAHACGEAVSREAGLSPPWLRASSMLKFSPRLGGCSKILKAVGHFGSSFSVVEAMRSSKDCPESVLLCRAVVQGFQRNREGSRARIYEVLRVDGWQCERPAFSPGSQSGKQHLPL